MITNNQIKFVKSLHQNKFRQKYNNFIAEGDKIAQEILKDSSFEIEYIFALEDWIQNNQQILADYREKIVLTDKRGMDKISALKTSSSILCVLQKKSEELIYENINTSRSIFLSDVQDPGNVGTIIRVADWFGVENIIRSPQSADFYQPKVVQSTMASFLNVRLYTAEYKELASLEVPKIGAVMNGIPLSNVEWPEVCMLIMGNESKGIPQEIEQDLHHVITIPGNENRVAESLNVGMATGIILSAMYA